jgi:dolichol-phosphate mannosyltransferase
MDLTILVPTYNERKNILILVNEIRCVIGQELQYEILFIDDSTDDTPQVLDTLSKRFSQVRYIHRDNARGLASAVVEGFRFSTGTYIIVMDADLQHPPSLIPLILERLRTADIVIPSRFINGGSDGGLNALRKFVSWTARMIGRWSIKRLRNISDCTSGYFGLHRKVIENVKLEPIGWKILMEVLVKGNHRTVHEIPYMFAARSMGESKMSAREQWNYLRHVARLVRSNPEDLRFYSFCIIGFTGVIVNMLALSTLVNIFRVEGMMASVGASVIAMIHNYVLNDKITWKGHKQSEIWRRALQLSQFMCICSLGILITALAVQGFLSLGRSIYVGQFVGIAAATFWNFSANNQWTWSNSVIYPKLIVTQECSREIS